MERSSRTIHKDDWLETAPRFQEIKESWTSATVRLTYRQDPIWIKVFQNITENCFCIQTEGFGNVFDSFASIEQAKEYAKNEVIASRKHNCADAQWVKACNEILNSF
tara:strand:+ start:156 stop:476 length:321 start_codon:yes stop_codon:yes gene_type:complete